MLRISKLMNLVINNHYHNRIVFFKVLVSSHPHLQLNKVWSKRTILFMQMKWEAKISREFLAPTTWNLLF